MSGLQVLWIVLAVILVGLVIYALVPVVWTRMLGRSIRTTGLPGVVSLTFDDGPHPLYTPRLLDVLKTEGVHATFFVLSELASKHPDIIHRMIEEGHDVQVHGRKHWFVPFLPPRQTIEQCVGAATQLHEQFGLRTAIYRPTWGACNLVSLWAMRHWSMRLCTWSVMVGDWRCTPAKELLHRIDKKLVSGSVIVLHDNDETPGAEHGAPSHVIELIPELAQLVRKNGLKFLTLSECL